MNQTKPGTIPMSKITDKTALYQGNQKASSYLQSQPTEEDNLRTLLEMMQKVGMEKVHELLNVQSSEQWDGDRDEWNQNFDLAL
jgi:hypothetical protein